MDPLIIREKLESLRRCIARVEAKRPSSLAALERLGSISPATPAAMRMAVGFRNVAVHNYDAISWPIVHSISQRHLQDFKHFAKEISASLGDAEDR